MRQRHWDYQSWMITNPMGRRVAQTLHLHLPLPDAEFNSWFVQLLIEQLLLIRF